MTYQCPECGEYSLSYDYGSDEDFGLGGPQEYRLLKCSNCNFVDNDSIEYLDTDKPPETVSNELQ